MTRATQTPITTLKAAPFSPSLSAVMDPLWSSATLLANARPIPLPPVCVFVFELVVNGSNMCCSSFVGIPIPSSLMVSSIFVVLFVS